MEKVYEATDSPVPLISRRVKYLTTFVIYFGNIAYGCAFNAYGPALLDLEAKYEVEPNEISVVVTVLTISMCVGGFTSGFLYTFISRQLGVVILLAIMALSMFAAPLCPTLIVFFVSAATLGFTAGAWDASETVWIMEMWQEESGPFIQAQHFSYALGSLIPSLVLAPFMTQESEDEESVTTTSTESSENSTDNLIPPFMIVGSLVALSSLAQLLLFIFARYTPPPPEEGRLDQSLAVLETYNNDKDEIESKVKPKRDYYRYQLIVFTAIFLGSYAGMEICTFQFFSTFAQYGSLGISSSYAAYTVSGLTGAFAVGRGLGILAILRFPPQLLLCIHLVLVTIANILLLIFSDTSRAWLWTGAILLGLGFSTIYPTFCVFMERHLLFTSWVGAFILIAVSVVSSIYPLIIGNSIEDNPTVITYTTFLSVFMCVLTLAITSWLVYNRQKKAKRLQLQNKSSI